MAAQGYWTESAGDFRQYLTMFAMSADGTEALQKIPDVRAREPLAPNLRSIATARPHLLLPYPQSS